MGQQEAHDDQDPNIIRNVSTAWTIEKIQENEQAKISFGAQHANPKEISELVGEYDDHSPNTQPLPWQIREPIKESSPTCTHNS